LRLSIAKDTHLPIMVSWTPPAPPQRGGRGDMGARGAPGPAAPQPGAQGQAPSAPPENHIYFADYRDVDGMQFPFRLRRAVGADTIEETTFDRYRVNAKTDPKRFEVEMIALLVALLALGQQEQAPANAQAARDVRVTVTVVDQTGAISRTPR
jgi:hypothetical protein